MANYGPELRRRFEAFLPVWLATLPASGWHGTLADLADELAAKAPWGVMVNGTRIGSQVRDALHAIRAAGWIAEPWRTSTTRGMTFRRIAA